MFKKMLCLLCAFGFLTAFNVYADETSEVANNDEVVAYNEFTSSDDVASDDDVASNDDDTPIEKPLPDPDSDDND